jgi:hypothetical protein
MGLAGHRCRDVDFQALGRRLGILHRLVARFYEELAAGKAAEEALEAARAAVRNTEAGRAPAA